MPRLDQETLARSLQVNLIQNPSKYIGLHFKLKGRRVADFSFLVDKLNSKPMLHEHGHGHGHGHRNTTIFEKKRTRHSEDTAVK